MLLPRHLWAGDWEADSESARQAAAQRRTEGADAPAIDESPAAAEAIPATPRRQRRVPKVVPIALAGAVLAAGAFGVGTLVGGGEETKPLEASSAAITPQKGQTRAGAVYARREPRRRLDQDGQRRRHGLPRRSHGTLVTNAHVVGASDHVEVRFGPDTQLDRRRTVLGTDPSSDLAV